MPKRPQSDDAASVASGDGPEKTIEKSAKRASSENARRRARAYAKKAAEAGYGDASVGSAAGVDINYTLVSLHNARALVTYAPSLEEGSYDKVEGKARISLGTETVTANAAREAAVRSDALVRWIVNKAVLNSVEGGRSRVDAATVAAVLRPYEDKLAFTGSTPPPGLIRAAQVAGVLDSSTKDEENAPKMEKTNAALIKHKKENEEKVKATRLATREANAAKAAKSKKSARAA